MNPKRRFRCMWRGLDGVPKCYAIFYSREDAEKLSREHAKVLVSFQFWVEETK